MPYYIFIPTHFKGIVEKCRATGKRVDEEQPIQLMIVKSA